MAGGVAVFDYNGDGRPDIFFTNGADLATLKKTSPKYSNHLFRNDGNGIFTDVTAQAGLAGTGFDIGVAVGRLRQRRPSGYLCRRRARQHALPQQRRRHIHRCDQEGRPRQVERSGIRTTVVRGCSLGRREQRRPARPLHRQLSAVELFRPFPSALPKASRIIAIRATTKDCPISSSSTRVTARSRMSQRSGAFATTSAREWAWAWPTTIWTASRISS